MDHSAEIEIALNRIDYYANLMITTNARLRWMLQEQRLKNQASPMIELPSDESESNIAPSRRKRRLKKLQEYGNKQKKEETSGTVSAEHVQNTHTAGRDPRVASLVQQQAPQLTQLLQPLQVRVPTPWPIVPPFPPMFFVPPPRMQLINEQQSIEKEAEQDVNAAEILLSMKKGDLSQPKLTK